MRALLYDDASDDGSDKVIRAWIPLLRARGVAVVASGSRWPLDGSGDGGGGGGGGQCDADAKAGGIGHGRGLPSSTFPLDLLTFRDLCCIHWVVSVT